MAILNNSNAISSGGYDINNSLRFRSSASASLSRTPASSGNRKTWTWSAWVKRGTLSVQLNTLLVTKPASSANDNNTLQFSFNSDNALTIGLETAYYLTTTQVFRDTSAWYHIVLAVDTTQATASNRVKIYINGTQVTAFSVDLRSSITQNQDLGINLGSQLHQIGSLAANTWYFDGYMADINFIDGSAKAASDFGETDTTTGVWKPKAYTGTYGTNGFYLKFSDIATTSGSNAGLGKDFSGNTNYWTTNNISVTAGVTYDAMTDSPTLTSATVGNYPVLNPLIKQGSGSVTEGNLKGAGSSYECWGTMAFPSTGKYYFEYTHNGSTGAGNGPAIGIVGLNKPDEDYGVKYNKNGTKWLNGTNSISYGASYTTGDVIGVAYDADSNSITFYKNNTSQGATTTASGYTYLPYHFDNSGSGGFLNFGQRPFSYTPPTGFVRLNTYNLPDSTIKKGNTVMDATTYTGNGSTQTVTNAAGFKPDLVWIKSRSAAFSHLLFDSIRGVTNYLVSDSTDAQDTNANSMTAFNTNGFSVGSSSNVNGSSASLVGWQWQAGQGSTSSNTSGSITSTVSVNTTAGFSIATFTTPSSNGNYTVGHGLGVAPKMIIARGTGSSNWTVWHIGLTGGASNTTNFIYLNSTAAQGSGTDIWGNSPPNSTTWGVNVGTQWGASSPLVAYCWAEIAGFSKFGSYTGNGSADGPFVYTGFRPKYILIKNSTTAGPYWSINDTSRNTYNVTDKLLFTNVSDAEATNVLYSVDILSNGFKVRNSNNSHNTNGDTYIYAAFAENPFKNANAR